MLREVFEIDQNGYITEKYVVEFDEEGNCLEELAENIVVTSPPDGLYRAKWTGNEWIEDMTQEEINALNQLTAEQEIAQLKMQLYETDYKIIKCSEYQLAGLELPYDIATLHTERQALRDRINELEVAQ